MTAPRAGLDPGPARLRREDFAWVTGWLRASAGIELKAGKENLVANRLDRRLRELGVPSFQEYFRLLQVPGNRDEVRHALDLLTTNETSFYREPAHFEMLGEFVAEVAERRATSAVPVPVRVWSAACSTGEEPYTIALTLADRLPAGQAWEVLGTDLSSRVLTAAIRCLYPEDAADKIPLALRKSHCLRGKAEYSGLFTFRRELRRRVQFRRLNLIQDLPDLGTFDVIFLRNVMIYFSNETKRHVVGQLASRLRPGGRLVIGHAETLGNLDTGLAMVRPSVYAFPQDG